jgi:hypothetical protein
MYNTTEIEAYEDRFNLSDYYSLTTKVTHNQGGADSEFGNAPVADQFELALDITG